MAVRTVVIVSRRIDSWLLILYIYIGKLSMRNCFVFTLADLRKDRLSTDENNKRFNRGTIRMH